MPSYGEQLITPVSSNIDKRAARVTLKGVMMTLSCDGDLAAAVENKWSALTTGTDHTAKMTVVKTRTLPMTFELELTQGVPPHTT